MIRPAVAVWAASTSPTWRTISDAIRSAASGNGTHVQTRITWLTSSWSGEGGWRKAFASPAIFPA